MSATANGSTIADILTRLDRLEQGGGEALVPTYLTVTPAGLVGADFTGLIRALGLIIPAGSSASPPSTNRIEWTITGGALVADIFGALNADDASWQADAYAQDQPGQSALALIARDDQGTTQAYVQATQIARGAMPTPAAIGANTELDGYAGGHGVRIIGADQSSSFLQLLSAQQLQIAFGASSVSWPGASPFSGTTTITYGIGRIAEAVFISPSATSAATLTGMDYTNLTGTTFQVQARTLDGTSPGAGVTAGFSWAALG